MAPIQAQSHIPIEIEVTVQTDPVDQPRQLCAAGQECFVLRQRQRAEMNAETVLAIPDTPADNRTVAQPRGRLAKPRPLARAERQPMADKFLQSHRDAEELRDWRVA